MQILFAILDTLRITVERRNSQLEVRINRRFLEPDKQRTAAVEVFWDRLRK